MDFFLFLKKYLFIWLHRVFSCGTRDLLVVACGIFSYGTQDLLVVAFSIFSCSTWDLLVAACGIFSCGMRALSCSMQDLVP